MIQSKDQAVLAALLVAIIPTLWIARKQARLGLLAAVAVNVGVPFVVATAGAVHSFGALRLLAWGVFAGFPCAAIGIAILVRKSNFAIAAASLVAALLTLGVYGFAFHIEPHRLEVNQYEIVTPRIAEPLRIVLLADIQSDQVGEFERSAIQVARDAKPDLILLAGDYLQCSSDAQLAEQKPLFRELFTHPPLTAPLGVFAVAGNCEYGWNWTPLFDGTGVTTHHRTTAVDLGPIVLTCLGFQSSRISRTVVRVDDRYHIALGHYPDFALGDRVDADLCLAGHCHGGQVRVPGLGPPITLSSVPRAWTQGLTKLTNGRHLIVSRGIGMERGAAPRLRFLCRPEVIVIDLIPAIVAANEPG